jgi:hypothetical protein
MDEPKQPPKKLYTATLKCAFCLKVLSSVQHCVGPLVGLPLKLTGRADCPDHPARGFVVDWTPEE